MNCNNGRGFGCGDSTCVSWSEYCDGVVNCETETDETNCRPQSCVGWWNAGYRDRTVELIRKLINLHDIWEL